jgi:hypothetical protein
MKMAIFWAVAPRRLLEVYRRFRGACCLHQGDEGPDGATTQMIAIFKRNMLLVELINCRGTSS